MLDVCEPEPHALAVGLDHPLAEPDCFSRLLIGDPLVEELPVVFESFRRVGQILRGLFEGDVGHNRNCLVRVRGEVVGIETLLIERAVEPLFVFLGDSAGVVQLRAPDQSLGSFFVSFCGFHTAGAI